MQVILTISIYSALALSERESSKMTTDRSKTSELAASMRDDDPPTHQNHLDIRRDLATRDTCVSGHVSGRTALTGGASCYSETNVTCATKYEQKTRSTHRVGQEDPHAAHGTAAPTESYSEAYDLVGELHLCEWRPELRRCEAGKVLTVCPEDDHVVEVASGTCSQGFYEAHPEANHGDVCRLDSLGNWACPTGCSNVDGNAAPYCVTTGTTNECGSSGSSSSGSVAAWAVREEKVNRYCSDLIHYHGNLDVNLTQCKDACLSDSRCKFITYYSSDGGCDNDVCLVDGAPSRCRMSRNCNEHAATSYVPTEVHELSRTSAGHFVPWAVHVEDRFCQDGVLQDSEGNEPTVTQEECQTRCANNANCNFYLHCSGENACWAGTNRCTLFPSCNLDTATVYDDNDPTVYAKPDGHGA